MEPENFQPLFECLKILEKKKIEFPEFGNQNKHIAHKHDNSRLKFDLIINRKGHLKDDYLTYQIQTKSQLLIRFDISGSPHENPNGTMINTPHIHIFDEIHDHGRIAIPLEELEDLELISDLRYSLLEFMRYNNISDVDIEIGLL